MPDTRDRNGNKKRGSQSAPYVLCLSKQIQPLILLDTKQIKNLISLQIAHAMYLTISLSN